MGEGESSGMPTYFNQQLNEALNVFWLLRWYGYDDLLYTSRDCTWNKQNFRDYNAFLGK